MDDWNGTMLYFMHAERQIGRRINVMFSYRGKAEGSCSQDKHSSNGEDG